MVSVILKAYLLLLGFAAIMVRLAGDAWWPATVLLFAPRWTLLLPLIPLLLLAAREKLAVAPLLASLVLLCLVADFNLPFHRPWFRTDTRRKVRILTCNIQNGKFDERRLALLVREARADLVFLQECPPRVTLPLGEGWQTVRSGELAILSRYPLAPCASFKTSPLPHRWPRFALLACLATLPGGRLSVCAVHLPSPRYGLQRVLDGRIGINPSRAGLLVAETEHRLKAALAVQSSVASLPAPVVVAGDFNMPATGSIYRKAWHGYRNAFTDAGFGFGWTERATVRGIPLAARVDHVLTGGGAYARSCQVGPEVGSDHLPLLADIVW